MIPQKVLVIDDESHVLKTTSFLLKKANIHSICARSGPEGLEIAAKELPDVILLDLKMPKMSGWDVVTQLKNDETLKKIPVILFSNETVSESDHAAAGINVIAILQKPLHLETLLALFKKIDGNKTSTANNGDASSISENGPAQGGQVKRIVVEQDMTGAFVNELEKRFLQTMNAVSGSSILLDLQDVHRIDSRGVALCIGLQKECEQKGAAFSIETNSEVHKTFQLFKLTRVINVKEAGTR